MVIKPTTPKIYTPQDGSCVLSLDTRDVRGGKIYDRSGKGNHGAITGASLKSTNYGLPVLSFDGVDDYVDVGNDASLDVLDQITMEALVKPNGASEKGYIIAKGNPASTKRCNLYWSGNIDKLVVWDGGDSKNSDAVFKENMTWVHCIVTINGKAISFYRNGVPVGIATLQDALLSNNDSLHLCNRVGGANSDTWFKGFVALACIYNRVFSPNESSERFNSLRHIFSI